MLNQAAYRLCRDAQKARVGYRALLLMIQEDNRIQREWHELRKQVAAHRAMVRAKQDRPTGHPVILRAASRPTPLLSSQQEVA